jgi:anti-anti-sigma factor
MMMRIVRRQIEGVTVIDCEGSIELGTGNDLFRAAMRDAADKGGAKLLLNFARVSYVDPAATGELMSRFTAVVRNGGCLKLVGVPDHVQEGFSYTRLATIPAFRREDDAIHSFGPALTGLIAVHRRAA